MNLEQAIAIVKPHNDRLAAEARADKFEREVIMLRSAISVLMDEIGAWEMDGPDGPTTVGELIEKLTGAR